MRKKLWICSLFVGALALPVPANALSIDFLRQGFKTSISENERISVVPGDQLVYPYKAAQLQSLGYGEISVPLLRNNGGGLQAISLLNNGRYQIKVRTLTNPVSFLDFRAFNGASAIVVTGTEISFSRSEAQTIIAMVSGSGQFKAEGFAPINIKENQGAVATDGQKPIVFEGFDKDLKISNLRLSRVGSFRIVKGCVAIGNTVQIDGVFVPLKDGQCFRERISKPEILVLNPEGRARKHRLQFQRFFGTGP